MKTIQILGFIGTATMLAAGGASAQAPTNSLNAATTNASPTAELSSTNEWSFSLSASTYFVPDDSDFVQPTFMADRDWLHLEARYQYEDLDTGSFWVGYNFSGGEKLEWEITPMVGGVFGDITGIAPGYRIGAKYWDIEFSTEGELVFDTEGRESSFFYTWSELSYAPADWIWAGLVVQRTKVYSTNFDVQRGFLVGLAYKQLSLTTYVFNPDESKPTVVLGLGWEF